MAVQIDARAGNGTTQAHPLSPTGGGANCALLHKIWINTSTAPTALVDSAGGSLAGGQWALIASGSATFVYARFGAPAGITSVTPTFGLGTYHSATIEFNDVTGLGSIPAAAEAAAQTAPSSGATGTLSSANQRVLGFFDTFTGGASTTFAAGATYAAETGTGLTAGAWGTGSTQAFIESKTVSATTAVTATATCASSYVYSVAVTLVQAAAPAGNSDQILLLLQ